MGKGKILHLFKFLSHELFTVVALMSPPTVKHLIMECKRHEELQIARILKGPFERLSKVTAQITLAFELPHLIRQIICQELQAYLSSLRVSQATADNRNDTNIVQSAVNEELRPVLHPNGCFFIVHASTAGLYNSLSYAGRHRIRLPDVSYKLRSSTISSLREKATD